MTQRNENSVLFSLGHLQQMALASAGQSRFSTPAPAVRTPSSGQPFTSGGVQEPPFYIPATHGSSPTLVAHRPTWPRWLAPVVIGMGALFLVFLVLAIAVALHGPPQVIAAPVAVAPITAPAAPGVAAVVAPTPPPPPTARVAAAVPLPTVTETAARPTEAVTQPTPTPKKKRAMVTKQRARRSRWARQTRTRRRHHARSSRRRRTRKAATAYRPARKLGDRELDDILNAASR